MHYSSTLSTFNEERRSIKLILLYNAWVILVVFLLVLLSTFFSFSYPPRYIYNRFMKFLTNNLRISSMTITWNWKWFYIYIFSFIKQTNTNWTVNCYTNNQSRWFDTSWSNQWWISLNITQTKIRIDWKPNNILCTWSTTY